MHPSKHCTHLFKAKTCQHQQNKSRCNDIYDIHIQGAIGRLPELPCLGTSKHKQYHIFCLHDSLLPMETNYHMFSMVDSHNSTNNVVGHLYQARTSLDHLDEQRHIYCCSHLSNPQYLNFGNYNYTLVSGLQNKYTMDNHQLIDKQ